MSEADKAKILDAGYWEFVELGMTHMLTGYDHLLFLFGVLFFLTKFKDVVKFITAFTIGHSLTLVFATIFTIKANYFLVDAVIALTVCYKGFDNLDGFKKYFDVNAPSLIGMVFVFGLIHGFGLSTRLQQLPLGEDGIVLRILAFNLGVEAGQIIALSVMLVLLSGWRKTESFMKFSKAANVALIIAGALLLLMQLHSYSHTTEPDHYPLNRDDHAHVHELMDAVDAMKKRSGLKDVDSKKHTHGDGAPHAHPEAPKPEPDVHSHGDGDPHSH